MQGSGMPFGDKEEALDATNGPRPCYRVFLLTKGDSLYEMFAMLP